VLSEVELKAVLAHEMGHLKHSDVVRNMHVSIAVAGLGGIYDAGRMLVNSAERERKKSRKKDDEDGDGGAGAGLILMGVGLASQGVAHGLRLAASRNAELRADHAAALAFGSEAMINALRKINDVAAVRPADLRNSEEGRKFAFAMISDGESKVPQAAPSGLRKAWHGRQCATHAPAHPRANRGSRGCDHRWPGALVDVAQLL